MSHPDSPVSVTAIRILIITASITVLASLILMGMRLGSGMSFTYPLHVITSGWEQESLFAMWKYVYGKDVYSDPYKIPYSIAFFNWLFYEVYGTFIAIIKNTLDLSDDWIPTLGRWMTLIGLICGTALSYATLRVMTGARSKALRGLFFLMSVYLMFGPLIGFWGFTVRSDIWAMVLEIAAVFLFWRFYPARPPLAAALAAVALFAAWSFKQIDVFSAIAIGLFLLFHLKIRALAVLTAVYFLLVATVLVVGSEEFISTIFLRPAIYGFDLAHLSMNFKNFVIKSTPTLFPLAVIALALVFSPSIRKAVLAHPPARFVAIALLPIFVLTLLISSKNGAAENYYFVFSFYAVLGVGIFLKIVFEDRTIMDGPRFASFRKTLVTSVVAGWATAAVAVFSVLFGFFGVTSVQDSHERLSAIKTCLHQMPTPVYNQGMYASLPWMNPSKVPIVLSWNYRLERKLGKPFERGGVGGMVRDGYFKSLLVLEGARELDGGSLAGYRDTGRKCAGFSILLRK
jgi:hypothetical protein